MPIADCGFPPFGTVPGSNPPQVVGGHILLLQKGPTTSVEIGYNPDFFHTDPAKVKQAVQTATTAQPAQLVDALIDTGAGESAIDEPLAQALQLPLVDQIDGSGIGGTEKFNVYLGHIRIAALGFVQYGRFMGVKLTAGNQPHQVLLGRSVLQGMILVYDGRDGTVRLAV